MIMGIQVLLIRKNLFPKTKKRDSGQQKMTGDLSFPRKGIGVGTFFLFVRKERVAGWVIGPIPSPPLLINDYLIVLI
jgi:hypothetical protein